MIKTPKAPSHSQPDQPSLRAVSVAILALASMVPGGAIAQSAPAISDTAQMSPLGFTGAINTPTADTLPFGLCLIHI